MNERIRESQNVFYDSLKRMSERVEWSLWLRSEIVREYQHNTSRHHFFFFFFWCFEIKHDKVFLCVEWRCSLFMCWRSMKFLCMFVSCSSCPRLMQVRSRLYELLTRCIPADVIMKVRCSVFLVWWMACVYLVSACFSRAASLHSFQLLLIPLRNFRSSTHPSAKNC